MTIAWINKRNGKGIRKKGEELKDTKGMKESKKVIFLMILYGSCVSYRLL